ARSLSVLCRGGHIGSPQTGRRRPIRRHEVCTSVQTRFPKGRSSVEIALNGERWRAWAPISTTCCSGRDLSPPSLDLVQFGSWRVGYDFPAAEADFAGAAVQRDPI